MSYVILLRLLKYMEFQFPLQKNENNNRNTFIIGKGKVETGICEMLSIMSHLQVLKNVSFIITSLTLVCSFVCYEIFGILHTFSVSFSHL